MTARTQPWLAMLAALAIAGCANRSDERTSTTGTESAEATAEAAVGSGHAPPVVPLEADAILARARDGGGATLVNMWATWCAPCRHEMPALLRVARAHRADGLRLMLVSADFDDQIVAVQKFLASQGVNDTTYLKAGDDNTFINTIHRDWTGALPATLVFDRHGRLTDFWEGAADENRFEHAVIAALANAPQPEEPK